MTDMDCRDLQNNLFAYGEGRLSSNKAAALEEHADRCMSCARLLNVYRGFESAVELEKAQGPNPFAATRILQYLENNQQSPARRAVPFLRPLFIAPALFFAAGLGFLIGTQGGAITPAEATGQPVEVLKKELFINDFTAKDLYVLTDQQ